MGQGREEESALRFGRSDMLLGDVAFEVGLAGFAEAFRKWKVKEGRSGRRGRCQGNESGHPRTCLANDAGEAGGVRINKAFCTQVWRF